MKYALLYTAVVIGLAIGSLATNVFAQTTANGPYYATPSWDQSLPSSTRFIVLSNMNNEAVLDRETGLVWERTPSTSAVVWPVASFLCNILTSGNRMGWRLPTIQELASLVDPSVPPPGPTLPAGHPFVNVQPAYWSVTSSDDGSAAWDVLFNSGGVSEATKSAFTLSVWCVRGGQGVDPQ